MRPAREMLRKRIQVAGTGDERMVSYMVGTHCEFPAVIDGSSLFRDSVFFIMRIALFLFVVGS